MTHQDQLSEAEKHLLELVRAGDADGWNQFVSRYERRLIAFATRRVDQPATAQDVVQETFIAFLHSMQGFRGDCELESYLFRLLRRRIVDHYRKTGKRDSVRSCDISDATSVTPLIEVASTDMTGSQHVRNNEQHVEMEARLSRAISQVTQELRVAEKFRDLKIAEGLFYAGLANQKLADLLSVTPNEIAVVKHRLVKRLHGVVKEDADDQASQRQLGEADLQGVWEQHRPSCPKRSTLGKYTLEILPAAWSDFVRFHVETLGCTFCHANLDELRREVRGPGGAQRSEHLFQSTIGFLPRSS